MTSNTWQRQEFGVGVVVDETKWFLTSPQWGSGYWFLRFCVILWRGCEGRILALHKYKIWVLSSHTSTFISSWLIFRHLIQHTLSYRGGPHRTRTGVTSTEQTASSNRGLSTNRFWKNNQWTEKCCSTREINHALLFPPVLLWTS